MHSYYFNTEIDRYFNSLVLEEIKHTKRWYHSVDQYNPTNDSSEVGDKSDTGFLMLTYSKKSDEYSEEFTRPNFFAEIILRTVLFKQKYFSFSDYSVERVLWNYYNKASTGIYHRDVPLRDQQSENLPDSHISIIYYLNSCDGGTEVEKENFYCKESHALVFASHKKHKGFGPFSDKSKWAVNIVLEMQNLKYNDMV